MAHFWKVLNIGGDGCTVTDINILGSTVVDQWTIQRTWTDPEITDPIIINNITGDIAFYTNIIDWAIGWDATLTELTPWNMDVVFDTGWRAGACRCNRGLDLE